MVSERLVDVECDGGVLRLQVMILLKNLPTRVVAFFRATQTKEEEAKSKPKSPLAALPYGGLPPPGTPVEGLKAALERAKGTTGVEGRGVEELLKMFQETLNE